MDYERLYEFAIDFNYISRMLEHYTNELDNVDGGEFIEKIQEAIREEVVEESLMRINEFYNEFPYDENDELDKSGKPQILDEIFEDINEYKCLVIKSYNNLKHLKCLIHEVIDDIYNRVQELLEMASFKSNEINDIVQAMDNLFFTE